MTGEGEQRIMNGQEPRDVSVGRIKGLLTERPVIGSWVVPIPFLPPPPETDAGSRSRVLAGMVAVARGRHGETGAGRAAPPGRYRATACSNSSAR
jgi:hypothetical protein